MPMLTTAIEDTFPPLVHRSNISGDNGDDFGDKEHPICSMTSSDEQEVHQQNDITTMSALERIFLSSLSISNKSMSSANDCILAEVIAQWDALSHREKDAAYKTSGYDYVELHRSKISTYFYAIIDGKGLDRRIVSVALSYLKIFLARHPLNESKGFHQLAMLTSLYMAIKIHSSNIYKNGRPAIFITEVVNWGNNEFTTRDICKMESSMLSTLDYYMNPPVAQHYLDIITPLIDDDDDLITPLVKQHIITISNWLCEISATDSFFTSIQPSSVAYAAILVAMDTSDAAGGASSVKCWFESLYLKHDEYITLQCYERMFEIYYLLDESPYENRYRCHSPTEVVVVPLGI